MLLVRNGEIVAVDLGMEFKERFPSLLIECNNAHFMTRLSQVVDLAGEHTLHSP